MIDAGRGGERDDCRSDGGGAARGQADRGAAPRGNVRLFGRDRLPRRGARRDQTAARGRPAGIPRGRARRGRPGAPGSRARAARSGPGVRLRRGPGPPRGNPPAFHGSPHRPRGGFAPRSATDAEAGGRIPHARRAGGRHDVQIPERRRPARRRGDGLGTAPGQADFRAGVQKQAPGGAPPAPGDLRRVGPLHGLCPLRGAGRARRDRARPDGNALPAARGDGRSAPAAARQARRDMVGQRRLVQVRPRARSHGPPRDRHRARRAVRQGADGGRRASMAHVVDALRALALSPLRSARPDISERVARAARRIRAARERPAAVADERRRQARVALRRLDRADQRAAGGQSAAADAGAGHGNPGARSAPANRPQRDIALGRRGIRGALA